MDIPTYSKKGHHDEKTQQYLEKDANEEYKDWEVVTIFYAALHYTNCFLLKKSVASLPQTHVERRQILRVKAPKDYFKAYMKLDNAAQLARYWPHKFLCDKNDVMGFKSDLEVIKRIAAV